MMQEPTTTSSPAGPWVLGGLPLYSTSCLVQLKTGSQCTKVEYRDGMDKPPNAGTPITMLVSSSFSSLQQGSRIGFGAEEGTRTPTPLRVRGPEPRASANSATSALETAQAS